ncbi:MAG: hypothetical protein IPM53_11330 [Anaerolineaceae bacterium]|nr:hypothetical protein [Anaerolineaceae bacterium]
MANEQNRQKLDQERPWRWGCGCFGAIGCAALLLVVVALAGVVTVGLLFTAPPLEFMSQLNDFVANELGWVVLVLLIVAAVVGGFIGSFGGKMIVQARANAQAGE